MKSISCMTTDEKLALLDRAEQWAEAYPSLMASVKSWEDAPVKDMDEGLTLCRALVASQSFLDSARLFEVHGCLTQIKIRIDEIIRIVSPLRPRTDQEIAQGVRFRAYIPKEPEPAEDGSSKRITEEERLAMEQQDMQQEQESDKWRPQNLKDYIHLLSRQTQLEASQVKERYYMPMREARVRLESLVENPDATTEQRAEAAQRLLRVEDALAKFWQKVDREYSSMMGHELPSESVPEKKLSEFTKEDIDHISDEQEREALKAARIENNKKYLRRKDLPQNEDTRIQLRLRLEEQQAWGIKVTPKQLENVAKYGVTLES